MDLEQEFEKLMRTVYKQIEDKVQSGELTRPEANQLITMVSDRMAPPVLLGDDGWSASTRACMGADYNYDDDDDGWSGSSRNC